MTVVMPAIDQTLQAQVQQARERALNTRMIKAQAVEHVAKASDELTLRIKTNNFHITLERAIRGGRRNGATA